LLLRWRRQLLLRWRRQLLLLRRLVRRWWLRLLRWRHARRAFRLWQALRLMRLRLERVAAELLWARGQRTAKRHGDGTRAAA
jgi:hypothetical protein